jgi:signal transduction histidine kinase
LTVVTGTGPHPELIGRSFPLAGSAVEGLLKSRRRSLVAAGGTYGHLDDELFVETPMAIAVALTRADESAAAAMYVVRQEPLGDDEVEALELLAAHAGAALHTAEIFAAAKELEDAKDLFLATASHELRTPLTVLRGFAETLLNHWDALDDDGRREIVRTILTRTEGMTGLVEQLLLGSRAGTGVPVRIRSFDLAAAVRSAAAAIAGSSAEHPLVLDVPPSVPALGDETSIDPVLGQLVENAVKYTPGGGPVEIAVRREEDAAVLTVADTGIGIPPDDVERIFDRFMRSSGATEMTSPTSGVGLGLYIVKRYVEAQGGRVVARAREGGGTVIEVRLPLP